ncbi:MAG TPA: mechanosensitive ion channel domain-containing protein [Flavisolibacter sp.]|nr:mechanosensitive ion channel domain-containing protein [Flavisolibacter sp.]
MDIKTNDKIRKEVAPAASGRSTVWMMSYILIALGFLVVYFLFRFGFLSFVGTYRPFVQRLAGAGFFIFILLGVSKEIEHRVISNSSTKKIHYNLIRLIRLLSVLLALFILVTFLFQKWYTAVVSLGLVSLILGFALQTPISSLVGWFYIIIRTPFRIGDRIQVGQFTGDVVEISYLDTTLWEFHGDYLSNDLPSGRLIRFPNTMVLQEEVYNYSWKKFPYIWNEIPFHVAYESDLKFVAQTIKEVATRELGPEMVEHIHTFKTLLEQTPVDELDIKEYPFVVFRTNANTWLEVSLTYLVAPKRASAVRSRLLEAIVTALLKEPDKVLFPNGNAR